MPLETSEQTTPENRVLQEEAGQVVAAAVARLPDIEKEVLILAHYEQLPLSEVAEIVKAEIGAVKSRLQRARETLRNALGSYAPNLKEKWERNR